MNLFQIAFNNIKRRKVKMVFLALGLIVGVTTAVAFLSIIESMTVDLGDRIDEFGANIVILPRSEGQEVHYGSTLISNISFDIEKLTLEDIPKIYESSVAEYINIVSPKLVGAVDINNQKSLLVGVETQKEFIQKPWFSLQEPLKEGNSIVDLALMEIPDDGIILGTSAAEALKLKKGDEVSINNRSFKVFGLLKKLGSEEDGLIYANLTAVQQLLDRPGELSMIEVSAYCNACPVEEIAMGLEEAIPHGRGIPLRQAALFREETISQFSTFGYALSGMVLLIAALVVLITMLSSVNERTREIGIFRAIGFRQGHILQIIFLEVGIVSITGGIVGFGLGSLAAKYAGPYLAQLQGDIPLRPELLLPAVLLSTGLAIIASAYPALKAARLNPAEAIRFI